MADKDYYSFEEVLKNLKLEEDELKRLVSAGEIRAFRDKNTMRFKAEDVDRLRGDAGGDLELDDLELELEDEPKPAPSVARAPVAPAPSRDIEELTLDDTGTTEEIELESSAPAASVEEVELGGEAESEAARPKARAARGAGPAASRRGAARVTVEDEAEQTEGVGTLAMLIVGAAILLCTSFVVLDAVFGHSSNPLSKAVSGMFK